MISRRLRIWIDIANTPHVLFFEPIIRDLERRGHAVTVTSLRRRRQPPLLHPGPSLIWASDLVVSGGGTMLREAAVLGVPAVSVFAGALGAVDRWLANQGRVTIVRTEAEARRVSLERRPPSTPRAVGGLGLSQIVQGICDTAEQR